MIRKERAYHSEIHEDEFRILVDRLWPRGISKDKLQLDVWMKDLGPSTVLRRWFNHEPEKFDLFKEKYLKELSYKPQLALLNKILELSKEKDIVLLFASKEEVYNQASILLEVLEGMLKDD